MDAARVLEELREKAKEVRWGPKNRKEHYAIFARSFGKRVREDDVRLYDLDDLAMELGWDKKRGG